MLAASAQTAFTYRCKMHHAETNGVHRELHEPDTRPERLPAPIP
jgi:hypothetical protein